MEYVIPDILNLIFQYIKINEIGNKQLFLVCKKWNEIWNNIVHHQGKYIFDWNTFIKMYEIKNCIPNNLNIIYQRNSYSITNLHMNFTNLKSLSFLCDTHFFDEIGFFWKDLTNIVNLKLRGTFGSSNHRTIHFPLLTKMINKNLQSLHIISNNELDDGFISSWNNLKVLKIETNEMHPFTSKLLNQLSYLANLETLKFKVKTLLLNDNIYVNSKLKKLELSSTIKINYHFEETKNIISINTNNSILINSLMNLQRLKLSGLNHYFGDVDTIEVSTSRFLHLNSLTKLKTVEIDTWKSPLDLKNLKSLEMDIYYINIIHHLKKISKLKSLVILKLNLLNYIEEFQTDIFSKCLFDLKNITKLTMNFKSKNNNEKNILFLNQIKNSISWMFIEIIT